MSCSVRVTKTDMKPPDLPQSSKVQHSKHVAAADDPEVTQPRQTCSCAASYIMNGGFDSGDSDTRVREPAASR